MSPIRYTKDHEYLRVEGTEGVVQGCLVLR